MTISMFNQVSVPQSELLSLIAAAKSLGVRGLAEEGVNLNARLVEITLLLNSSLLKYLIPQQQKVTTYLSLKLLMEGVNRNTRLVEITMLLSRRHLFKYATFECQGSGLNFFGGRSLLSALPLGVLRS